MNFLSQPVKPVSQRGREVDHDWYNIQRLQELLSHLFFDHERLIRTGLDRLLEIKPRLIHYSWIFGGRQTWSDDWFFPSCDEQHVRIQFRGPGDKRSLDPPSFHTQQLWLIRFTSFGWSRSGDDPGTFTESNRLRTFNLRWINIPSGSWYRFLMHTLHDLQAIDWLKKDEYLYLKEKKYWV